MERMVNNIGNKYLNHQKFRHHKIPILILIRKDIQIFINETKKGCRSNLQPSWI
jgi:hypothetical protein